MKSQASNLLEIAGGILRDVSLAYQEPVNCARDLETLSYGASKRGLEFFTLDLPQMDAALLAALSTGHLDYNGPFSRKASKTVLVPRLFRGLWLRVFEADLGLKQEPDVNAILFLRQLCCLGKKVAGMCDNERLAIAVEEFHNVERTLPEPTLKWELDEFDPGHTVHKLHFCDALDLDLPLFPKPEHGVGDEAEYDRGLLERCQQVADFLSNCIRPFEPVTYSYDRYREFGRSGFRHGPGAVAERSGLVNKYDFPNWPRKLEQWFPYREVATLASDLTSQPRNHEVPSRLLAVPKTAKGPRLIAAEPTEHQWCQQAILQFLVDEFRRLFRGSFITLQDQEPSRAMALRASEDGSLSTIDLSSASDRLSCWAIERMFRRNALLLHSLHACRTRYLRDNTLGDNTFVKLRKFASQGTACTFPVQSLFFLTVALAACLDERPSWTAINKLRDQVRVFGDDIIVPNERYAVTRRLLTLLHLRVNDSKSFHTGGFRESCGMDAYAGYDVTPVKPTTVVADTPTSVQSLVDFSNNLFTRGFWKAAEAVERIVGDSVLDGYPIVGTDVGVTGLTSFCGSYVAHLRTRWNKWLHRYEVRCRTLMSRQRRKETGERFALLQWFTEAPPADQKWSNGVAELPVASDGRSWEPLDTFHFQRAK